MRHARFLLPKLLLLLGSAAFGHEPYQRPTIVIDTDMGLDDVVALALVLQSPDMDVAAIVACEGAAGRDKAIAHLERMLDRFNRSDVALFAPAQTTRPPPPPQFRTFAEEAVGAALPDPVKPNHRPFSPDAYGGARKPIVLALGPLTNLAAALQASPGMKQIVEKLVVPGPPDPQQNWNLAYDQNAWKTVRASGVRLEFVVPDPALRKPSSWQQGQLSLGQRTSIGEDVIRRLLETPRTREHYVAQWPGFSDELAVLYCLRPGLFTQAGAVGVLAPHDARTLLELFTRCVCNGRQRKERVVLAEGPLPDKTLQPDVRRRAPSIIAKNGETEWLAQLVTSELHDHLGAYSAIGAKMGLRAAELLNAPPHAMKVTSRSAREPPVSCLNDGVIVATGSTPGRGLFTHLPGAAGSTEVQFAYNDREIVLSVKPDFRRRIAAQIERLRNEYGLARHEYWDGVRRLALDIWENWHRRDLFDIKRE